MEVTQVLLEDTCRYVLQRDRIVSVRRNDHIAMTIVGGMRQHVRDSRKDCMIELQDVLTGMEISDGRFTKIGCEHERIRHVVVAIHVTEALKSNGLLGGTMWVIDQMTETDGYRFR